MPIQTILCRIDFVLLIQHQRQGTGERDQQLTRIDAEIRGPAQGSNEPPRCFERLLSPDRWRQIDF